VVSGRRAPPTRGRQYWTNHVADLLEQSHHIHHNALRIWDLPMTGRRPITRGSKALVQGPFAATVPETPLPYDYLDTLMVWKTHIRPRVGFVVYTCPQVYMCCSGRADLVWLPITRRELFENTIHVAVSITKRPFKVCKITWLPLKFANTICCS
jgi:hypothetical protein